MSMRACLHFMRQTTQRDGHHVLWEAFLFEIVWQSLKFKWLRPPTTSMMVCVYVRVCISRAQISMCTSPSCIWTTWRIADLTSACTVDCMAKRVDRYTRAHAHIYKTLISEAVKTVHSMTRFNLCAVACNLGMPLPADLDTSSLHHQAQNPCGICHASCRRL